MNNICKVRPVFNNNSQKASKTREEEKYSIELKSSSP
jgi:hypothetical protein